MFADALVWSDETPPLMEVGNGELVGSKLRGVWHYRTSLIEGNPKEKFRAAWEEALRCFPNWPGFLSERRDPALAPMAKEMRETGMKRYEESEEYWEKKFQASQARKAASGAA